MTTPEELTASANFIAQFELLQWAVGILVSFITALGGGFIWQVRESRAERREQSEKAESERREWRAEILKMQERTLELIEKNNEVVARNTQQTERLIEIVDRTESTTATLERLILQKLR